MSNGADRQAAYLEEGVHRLLAHANRDEFSAGDFMGRIAGYAQALVDQGELPADQLDKQLETARRRLTELGVLRVEGLSARSTQHAAAISTSAAAGPKATD